MSPRTMLCVGGPHDGELLTVGGDSMEVRFLKPRSVAMSMSDTGPADEYGVYRTARFAWYETERSNWTGVCLVDEEGYEQTTRRVEAVLRWLSAPWSVVCCQH